MKESSDRLGRPAILEGDYIDEFVLRDDVVFCKEYIEGKGFLPTVAARARGHHEARPGLSSFGDGLKVIVRGRSSVAISTEPVEGLGEHFLGVDCDRPDAAFSLGRSMSAAHPISLVGCISVSFIRSTMNSTKPCADVIDNLPVVTCSAPRKPIGPTRGTLSVRRTRRHARRSTSMTERGEIVVSRAIADELAMRTPTAAPVAPLLSVGVASPKFVDCYAGFARKHRHCAIVCLRHTSILAEVNNG